MDKNENGYPGGTVGGVTDQNRPGGCNPPDRPNGGVVGGVGTGNGCGGSDTCLDERPLAYVYAPDQHFRMLYSAYEALAHGTLFEELYKPKEVYGRE